MARVANTKRVIANRSVSYIINKLKSGLKDFFEELDEDSKFSTTYKAGRDTSAKDKIDDAIRMLRWLYETEFSLTPPAPFTNGDVDTIEEDIRTFEDGLP